MTRAAKGNRRLPLVAASAVIGAVVALLACSTPSADARIAVTTPDRAAFAPVADILGQRCGTLDCHGSTARNLRIYGHLGLRLAATDRPLAQGITTEAELDETFTSLVDLEPEVLTALITEGGGAPERLTLVRKARGTEHHKGGALFQAGSDEDTCLTSWLGGTIDAARCEKARAALR